MKNLNFIKLKLIYIFKYDDIYFNIYLKNKLNFFIGGQFIKLALKYKNDYIYRFYSLVNSPYDKFLEFYISRIKNGYLSNKLYNLNINSNIYISKLSYGKFTIFNILKNKNIETLWMICNGTGISSFLSILKTYISYIKKNVKNIFLLWGIKHLNNFHYLNVLLMLQRIYNNNIFNFIISVSNFFEYIKLPFYYGRVSNINLYYFICNKFNIIINNNNRFMICGSSKMFIDVFFLLNKKFNILKKNIISEVYF